MTIPIVNKEFQEKACAQRYADKTGKEISLYTIKTTGIDFYLKQPASFDIPKGYKLVKIFKPKG